MEENYLRQALPPEDETNSEALTERNGTQVKQQQSGLSTEEADANQNVRLPTQELENGEINFALSRERTSTQMGSLLVPSYTLPREVRLMADIYVLLHCSKYMVVPSGQPLGSGKSFEMYLGQSTMRFDAKIFLLDPPNL